MRRSRKSLYFFVVQSTWKKFPIKIVTAWREKNISLWMKHWRDRERRFSSFFHLSSKENFAFKKPIFMNEISMLIAWFLLRLCSDRFAYVWQKPVFHLRAQSRILFRFIFVLDLSQKTLEKISEEEKVSSHLFESH